MKKDVLNLCLCALVLIAACSKEKNQDLDPNIPKSMQDIIDSEPCEQEKNYGQGYIIQLYSWNGDYIYQAGDICMECNVMPLYYDEEGNQLNDINLKEFMENATLVKTVWRCERSN